MEEELKDVFIPKSRKYKIKDKVLEMKPLPFKKFIEALRIVEGVLTNTQEKAKQNEMAILNEIPKLLLSEFTNLTPLLFDDSLSKEWVEDNFDVPTAQQVIFDAIEINGVTDFLEKIKKMGVSSPQKTEV